MRVREKDGEREREQKRERAKERESKRERERERERKNERGGEKLHTRCKNISKFDSYKYKCHRAITTVTEIRFVPEFFTGSKKQGLLRHKITC